MQAPLLHYTFRSFAQYWKKMERYSDWSASELWRQGKRAGVRQILLHPVARFGKTYLLEQGFRDGLHGLVLCMLTSFTVFLKYAKLWERQQAEAAAAAPLAPPPPPPPR